MEEPTLVHCPSCQAKLKLAQSEFQGKKIRCPKCKTIFVSSESGQPEPETGARRTTAKTLAQPAPHQVPSNPQAKEKPRRLSPLVRIAILVNFLVLLGGAAAAWLYFSGYWIVIFGGPVASGKKATPPPAFVDDGVWLQDFASAKKKAAEENKDILLSFEGSDWCIWCQKMDKEIRSLPEFQSKAGKKFVLVKVDFPNYQPALSRVKDPVANQQLLKQFNITSYPTMVLTDASGYAFGVFSGFPQGGVSSFLADLDKLRQIRIERDELLAAVNQTEGAQKLPAAQKALQFLEKKMLLDTLKQQLPRWLENAQRLDANNEKGFLETFFVADWHGRFQLAPSSGLPALLREMEDWKKKYGHFKDKEKEASVCLVMARGKAELEDFEGAFSCLDEGLQLEPKNPFVRKSLQFGEGLSLSTGTAFAINDKGHYLTNYHVVLGPKHIYLQIPGSKQLQRAKLVAQNQDLDLAVVQIDVPKGQTIEPMRIASDRGPKLGEKVGTLGYPLGTIIGQSPSLTQGAVSNPTDPANRNMIKLNVLVNPGNSGGPLWDARGDVIGMVTARTTFLPNNFGLAVPSKDIAAFLNANQVPFLSSEPTGKDMPWEDIGRRISPAVARVIKGWSLNPATKDLALNNGELTEESKLDFNDGRDPTLPQCFAKVFSVKLERGKRYQIDMMSSELDSFLRLEDAHRKQFLQSDDNGAGHDARLLFDCPADGTYKIIATTRVGGTTGNFTLKVKVEGMEKSQ